MTEILKLAEEKMNKTMNALDRDFSAVRAGRANPSVLDRITVDYYGTPTPINQMAAISVPEGRMLLIQPWDATTLKAIEKAIQTSDLGINPQNDGKVIRLVFPALTEERRRDLTRDVKKMGEDAKVALRSIRRDAMEKAKAKKKNNEITEDDLANAEKKIQTLTDNFCKEAEELTEAKEKEILSILNEHLVLGKIDELFFSEYIFLF